MTTFRIATESDDALLRAILRENAMRTWVDMAVEREPSFFAGKNIFGRDWAVIAEHEGDVVGMYTAAVVPVHVDGRPEQVGYLGGLRVNHAHRTRIRHLREGYASIRPMAQARATVPWWFTVIATENGAARRLLEGGVRGLPAYHPRGEYITYAIPTSRGRRHGSWRRATVQDVGEIVERHNAEASRFQCSPVLSAELVQRIGAAHFFIHDSGVAALWNQCAYKQVVARRYRTPIGALVPLYNAYAKLFRRIPLPPEGGSLDQTFIAFLALRRPERTLIEDLLSYCETPAASLGLHAENPLVRTLEQFKPMRYPARVYAVSFDDREPPAGRPMQPEAALL